jgi:flagellar M-ring protein FliF
MTSIPVPRPDAPASGRAAALTRLRGPVAALARLADQPAVRRALPSLVMLAAAGLALAAWLVLRETPRSALYPGLPEAEKAQVLEALAAGGIAATVDARSGEVTVPAADYHRARLALAAQGLPESAPDADRILADLPMGASRALETARLRQAREMELARTITEIGAVQAARVHLALPEKSAFLRDSQPPGASVFVTLAAGRALDEGQVEAIVNLVAAAVPGMARDAVAVIDQRGRLLSQGARDAGSQLSDRQLRHRVEVETLLRRRIEAVLTPVVGAGNLSVEVTAALDFTQREETEERVDPAQRAVLSEQTSESETRARPAGGIPGAVSNTPPPDGQLTATPPNGTPARPDTGVQTRTAEATRNYEVSRTVTSTRPEFGQVTRISAAVAIRAPAAEDGAALPPALLADLQRLAETAVGFDAARGDSVTVVVQPFVESPAPPVATAASDLSWLPGLLREAALVAVVALIALGVLRPLLLRPGGMLAAAPGGGAGTVEVAEGETLDDLSARLDRRQKDLAASVVGARATRAQKQAVLRQIAGEDPARAAAVLHRMLKPDLDKVQ